MTDTNDDDTTTIAEAVNGWGAMKARQVDRHQWNVLSWRNDSVTVHRVDRIEPSCTCLDKEFNCAEDEACGHMAAVEFQADQILDVGDYGTAYMSQLVSRAHEAVQKLENSADVAQAKASADAVRDVAQDDSAETDEDEEFFDDVTEGVSSWLIDEDVEMKHLRIGKATHNGTGGVGIWPDNEKMADKEYNWFKDVLKESEAEVSWHLGFRDDGCPNCDESDDDFYVHLPAGELPEVVG